MIRIKKNRLIAATALILFIAILFGGSRMDAYAKTVMPGISLNGNVLKLDKSLGAPFVDKNNRTQVPLRGPLEAIGAEVSWDQENRQATVLKDEVKVTVPLGAPYIFKDGIMIQNDTESVAVKQRIYLPIRVVMEAFGAKVDYDYKAGMVVISTSKDSGNTEKPDIKKPDNSAGQEMRAMWISYLEFNVVPKNRRAFENAVNKMYDDAKAMKMNSVIVQVRPFADAMYPSKYFPWSKYASGTRGKNPGYDPLAYMVNAAHARGLQFHAWVNPYRIGGEIEGGSEKYFSGWLEKRWILNHSGQFYFNPAVAEVRQYITDGIKEIVEGYDVDGIHFDDYFYPSLKGQSFDNVEYTKQNSGSDIVTWRRNNVNMLVSACYSTIKAVKPNVVFGISPAGNIDNLKRKDAYFVDIEKWFSTGGYVDYIMPQLYWGFEAKRNGRIAPHAYANNLKRWIALKKQGDVTLYVGLSLAYAGQNTRDGNAVSEWLRYNDIVARQVRHARNSGEVSGFAFFRSDIFKKQYAKSEVANLIKEL